MARKTVESPTKAPKIRRIAKELPVDLSQTEWEDAVRKSRQKNKEVELLRGRKKETIKDFTDRILVADREEKKLGKMVDTRTEERMVDCEEVADFDTNRIYFKRLDTGEEFDERAMSSDERNKLSQGSLIEDGE